MTIVKGPNSAFSKVGNVAGAPETTNLSLLSKGLHATLKTNTPHESRYALKDILIEVRVTRVFGDDAKNCNEALQSSLINGCQSLSSGNDHSHSTCTNVS